MASRAYIATARSALSVILVCLTLIACAVTPPSASSAKPAPPPDDAAYKMQALVMDMADDYIAALGESVYLLTRSGKLDTKARWLAQSFLRNGVGASLDIAVGPNPPTSLLDLLVLSSLQTWSFEAHWMPAGIGEAGTPALDRLKRAEADLWATAGKHLTADQLSTLRGLIDAWISENPNRTVVALVRFNEFADERKISSLSLRGKAQGLLREVSEAGAAVEDVRLLGERLLWFAGRYPYVLGEQAELTAYRLVDQPEGAQLMEAVASFRQLSEALTKQIASIQSDLEDQLTAFFSRVSAERGAAIDQLQAALEATVKVSLERAAESIVVQRTALVNHLFDRFAQERKLLLEDIASRQKEFLGLMTEIRETISVSGTLAKELTGTVNAIDRVVGRFDTEPGEEREPLRMADVRDAAIETGRAADRMSLLLGRFAELLESESWENRISSMTSPADEIVDRLFWRGVILVCLLLVGVGLIRMLPQRKSDKMKT